MPRPIAEVSKNIKKRLLSLLKSKKGRRQDAQKSLATEERKEVQAVLESLESSMDAMKILPNSATFHYFSELPTEIRLQIWRLTMPGPRVLTLDYDLNDLQMVETADEVIGDTYTRFWWNLDKTHQLHYKDDQKLRLATKRCAPPPVGISVCQESRAEVLRFFKVHLDTIDGNYSIPLDPDKDVLRFPSTRPLCPAQPRHEDCNLLLPCPLWEGSFFKTEALRSIRHLAIPLRSLLNAIHNTNESYCVLERYTSLKDITIECHSGLRHFPENLAGAEVSFECANVESRYVSKGGRALQSCVQYIRGRLLVYHKTHRDWQVPELAVKVLCVNGKRCCIEDEAVGVSAA